MLITLRDQALAGLEKANPNLHVTLTLPVLPTGLVASGLNVLQSAKQDGVRVDVVNIMTIDYGTAVDNNGQMGLDAINAIEATEQQLSNLGVNSKICVTPMIGVNDIASEVFKLSDAQALENYAQSDPTWRGFRCGRSRAITAPAPVRIMHHRIAAGSRSITMTSRRSFTTSI
jgi:chitinase